MENYKRVSKNAVASEKRETYREVTPEAIILGVIWGAFMAASFTYAGMIMGFTSGGSAIAAIVGWGILRGLLKKGTIVENNIVQTIASAVNISVSGVIFTIPALYIMGLHTEINTLYFFLATAAGAILGITFIIPLRKQMIEIDRLRFPTGTAVATVLKTPGSGIEKTRLLLFGMVLSAVVYLIQQFPILGLPHVLPEVVDLGSALHLPSWINLTIALSLMVFGMGLITGRNGLIVLAGGVLSYYIITPLVKALGWIPSDVQGAAISSFVYGNMTRPLGIGMLLGGSIAGLILSLPVIAVAIKSLAQASKTNDKNGNDELPISYLYIGAGLAFILLFITTYKLGNLGVGRSLLTALVGVAWIFIASLLVAMSTGMTDWSPVSGLSLVSVIILLYLTNKNIPLTILLGATVGVAISGAADMMQDLKTGHLVGGIPSRQQKMELLTAWIGPIIALTVVGLIWKAYGIGNDMVPAPQAMALKSMIEAILGGNVPVDKFLAGGLLGFALSMSGVPGLGVLVGLSMYLPILYIIPYGIGCVVHEFAKKRRGHEFITEKVLPFAAGLMVGEAAMTLLFAVLTVAGVLHP
ncbi:OPT family oligopeptide transporter [Thermococcus sp. M39]|uniref:OPT family oligopeptide transporter n=1 Tax=unclassified Thermococcus TaxID=2627626 RepID=UPI001438D5C2|nr:MULTISPECIES: OPT family oligopeptide transporter [unclassified Thermococcus]NJE08829.1 OPT family oligopeptide transporter [Thermococcus sp. M39]NJE13490.1 OPT family oligopeptide transporter [Thermococcus sp. LS2]